MKKMSSFKSMNAALGIVAMAASGLAFAGGTFNFEGELTTETCVVTGGNGVTGSGDLTVAMEHGGVGEVNGAPAKEAQGKAFSIKLVDASGEVCGTGSTGVGLSFVSGPNVDTTNGTLKNSAPTTPAANVHIILRAKPDGTGPVVPADPQVHAATNAGQPKRVGAGELNYLALYKAIGGNAVAGKVASRVAFQVAYY